MSSRAALAGNPSDGYGGAVVSMMVPTFQASARLVTVGDASAPIPIVASTIARCARDLGVDPATVVTVESNIPRSVGLAGSSAIVIATIRALEEGFGLALTPEEVADLAYRVEREDLGIAGGWQDQIVQSHGTTGLMEFGGESITHRRLVIPEGPDIPMFVAWSERDSEASGESHAALQARRESSLLRNIMAELADCARAAAAAIERRDVHAVKEAMGRTFTLRCEVMEVSAPHRLAVERAGAHGAVANVTGSGGAVVGVMPKDDQAFSDEMRRDGYDVVALTLQ